MSKKFVFGNTGSKAMALCGQHVVGRLRPWVAMTNNVRVDVPLKVCPEKCL